LKPKAVLKHSDTMESPDSSPRQYQLDEFGVQFGSAGADALAVHAALRAAGHEAYLVGGCVRDLLLGHEPKDFDVATSARPEAVHALFRRSRIIGRRFQIVHVRGRQQTIEVSTFRGHHSPDFDSESEDEMADPASSARAESGMLLRDNVFGTVEEDALRRDFTINGLYYDSERKVVLDFNTGVADLRARLLRVIGDPVRRYQEDPVRMLRAMRFAAKLNFRIEPGALSAIAACRHWLTQVSPARMFDEILKLFLSGHGERSFELLDQHGLFAMLFPATASAMASRPEQRELIVCALRNSDERIALGKPVTPAFLYAALLWPALCEELRQSQESPVTSTAMQQAVLRVIRRQSQSTTIPRRFATPMREIWELQHRLIARKQAQRLAAHPRFRAAYDFILLREQAGESLNGAGEWWTRFQAGEATAVVSPSPARRRRRRGRRTGRAEPV
jgi:poly(A) polymerase